MTDGKKPAPPKVLGKRGRALWRELHELLEFDTHETALVLEACRSVDTIDNLQAVIDADGYTTVGSMGQTVVHPAIAELRQQQQGLVRLLSSLNISAALEGETGAVGMARAISSQATAAANARWSKSKKARGA